MSNLTQLSKTFLKLKNFQLLEILLHLKSFSQNNTYLVGGCVRNSLLGLEPKDFDIVTDVPLDDIIPVLKNNGWHVKEAGKQFLVVIATKNNNSFELANFRKEGSYLDGRRPSAVDIGTLEEDCLRRDLTINSLYYDVFNNVVLDPSGFGLSDLDNKIIRFNGKAEERVKEDYLRVCRVYRFASVLNFSIEKKTLKACRINFDTVLKTVSSERVMSEIEKMVKSITCY